MNELTIEQKAKAYDEALKVLHKYDGVNIMFSQSLKEEMFPELKEEGDELTWLINYISEEAYYLSMDLRDKEDSIRVEKLQKSLAWLKKQGKVKPVEWGEEDERISKTIIIGIENAMFSDEMRETYQRMPNTNKSYYQIRIDWLKSLKDRYTLKPNPYSGTSFVYNNHTWGMCARDNGVEILIDGEIKAFISSEKSFIYPTPLQHNGTSKVGLAIEAIKEEAVDNTNKPSFTKEILL